MLLQRGANPCGPAPRAAPSGCSSIRATAVRMSASSSNPTSPCWQVDSIQNSEAIIAVVDANDRPKEALAMFQPGPWVCSCVYACVLCMGLCMCMCVCRVGALSLTHTNLLSRRAPAPSNRARAATREHGWGPLAVLPTSLQRPPQTHHACLQGLVRAPPVGAAQQERPGQP